MKYSFEQYKEMWGEPQNVEDIIAVFVKFCTGEIAALPWSEGSLAPESKSILSELIELNSNGYLTINSQPAVDGVPSTHPVHGWGPKNGFVYQKAYLEFFVAPERIDSLIERMNQFPYLTFHAVNKAVILRDN
jgi:methylenetetrahydrofolate reductase (NADPH)